MQVTSNTNQPINFDDEIDLRELLNFLFQKKLTIFSLTAFISFIAIIYSLLLPNIYESKALLAPIETSSGISAAMRNYSGLAGIAGITLPSVSDEGNSTKAIKKISSLSFFENHLLKNIHLPDLMAIEHWDPKTNTVNFDESVYDKNRDTWVRNYSYPKQQIPSAQESFEIFTKNHLSLSVDKKTQFITLSIKHQSPYIAKQWIELVVDEINKFYRERDKFESEKVVSYLNDQISKTSFSEIKEVLAQLLQEETKKLTLIEANQFYVFEYIDPPAVMEKKSGPKRALICIFGAILGGVLGIFLVLIRYYFRNEDAS